MRINGVILDGGKSSRMGSDKGSLKINNKTFMEIAIERFDEVDEVIVIGNNEKKYKEYNTSYFKDLYTDKGPLGGIYTALTYSENDILITPCDTPLLDKDVIKEIIIYSQNIDINKNLIVSIDDKIEPLCGIYRKKYVNDIKHFIEDNELSVKSFLDKVGYEVINLYEHKDKFKNINYKSDYKKIIEDFTNININSI